MGAKQFTTSWGAIKLFGAHVVDMRPRVHSLLPERDQRSVNITPFIALLVRIS